MTAIRTARLIGSVTLLGLFLSGCGGSSHITSTTSTTAAPAVAPADVVTPLYLGPGVGIVAEVSPSTNECTQLLATTDFSHWRNISPPQPSGADGTCPDIWQSASFVSPLQGWVLGRNGGGVNTVLYRTDDGGTTWIQETGSSVGSNGGSQVIGFTSAEDGWRQQFATGSNAPYLLETTADGGERWTGIPQVAANGGCAFALDVFANPLDGFAGNNLAPGAPLSLAPPPPQAFLWQTADGGRSWHRASVPPPAGSADTTAFYGLPTFFSPTTGILPVEYVASSAAGVATLDFSSTSDGGSSWAPVSTVRIRSAAPATPGPAACFTSPASPASPAPSAFPAVAIASPTTWWVISPGASGTTVDVTSNAGRSWTDVSAAGLAAAGAAGADLSFVGAASPLVAWVTSINEASESAPLSFQTADGGRTWSPIAPAAHPAVPGTSGTLGD